MIYQWVYSYSCWNRQKRPGDARTRGFGTFSWTEGLELDDINELERRCSGFSYPTDADIPARPTQDEIDRLLPVGFYSFTLASGKRAIVRTRYVGEGFYDKRWGAIISHGLILPEGEEWPLYPMEYFDSPIFWNELPQTVRDEAVKYKDVPDSPQPAYLPALDFDSLKPQGKYTPDGVAARINGSKTFAEMLSAFLKAYIGAKTDTEPLCVCAPHDDVPWLFAGLTMAFPLELSAELSFSTYLSDKMPMESEIGRWYNVAAMERRNALIDLGEQPGDDDCKWYINTLFGSRKNLMEFLQDFTGLTAADAPCAVKLFRFLKENGSMTEEDMGRTRMLLLEHGDADVRKEFIDALASGRGMPDNVSSSWFSEMFTLVADYEELRPLCYDLFLKQRARYQGDLFAFFAEIEEKHPHEITVLWLDDYAAGDLTTTGLLLTFFSLSKNGRASELNSPDWAMLFGDETKGNAGWGEIVAKSREFFADCSVAILCDCPDKAVQEKEFDRISQDTALSADFACKAIAMGKRDVAKELLKKHLQRKCKKPLDTLKKVFATLEKADAEFAKENFWEFFSCVNGNIESIDSDSLSWLLAQRKRIPPADDLTFLKDLDSSVAFPEGKDSSYLALLERLLSDEAAKELQFGRIGLIAWFLRNLNAGAKVYDIEAFLKEMADLVKAYRCLSPGEQSVLCANLLPIALGSADDKKEECAVKQHGEILLFFGATTEQSVRRQLAKRYVGLIGRDVRKNRINTSDIRFVAGLKCALGALGDSGLRKQIHEELATQFFRKFGDADLDRVKRDLGIRGGVEKRNWEELCEEVRKSKTLFARVKSLVRSFFRRK